MCESHWTSTEKSSKKEKTVKYLMIQCVFLLTYLHILLVSAFKKPKLLSAEQILDSRLLLPIAVYIIHRSWSWVHTELNAISTKLRSHGFYDETNGFKYYLRSKPNGIANEFVALNGNIIPMTQNALKSMKTIYTPNCSVTRYSSSRQNMSWIWIQIFSFCSSIKNIWINTNLTLVPLLQ